MLPRPGRTVQSNHLLRCQPVHSLNQGQIPLADAQNLRPGNLQHLRQFLGLGPEVQRHVNSVQQRGGKVKFNALVAINLHRSHPVALTYAQVGQPVSHPVHPFLKLRKGELLPFKQQRRTVRYNCARYQ